MDIRPQRPQVSAKSAVEICEDLTRKYYHGSYEKVLIGLELSETNRF